MFVTSYEQNLFGRQISIQNSTENIIQNIIEKIKKSNKVEQSCKIFIFASVQFLGINAKNSFLEESLDITLRPHTIWDFANIS